MLCFCCLVELVVEEDGGRLVEFFWRMKKGRSASQILIIHSYSDKKQTVNHTLLIFIRYAYSTKIEL